jgi:serine/threonine protein kinase
LDDFILVKTVGKGSFGKVVMVRKKDDSKIYAMKILKKEMVLKRKQYEHTLAERRILENIDHPFIVSLRFAFQTEHKLYMVFDFFNGGELYHYLSEGGRFTEDRARFYAAEIASALDYLHRHGVVYRDLKPENLILDAAGHIRITDFGCVTPDRACRSAGSPLRGLASCDLARLRCGPRHERCKGSLLGLTLCSCGCGARPGLTPVHRL